jgi:hypothetical protein
MDNLFFALQITRGGFTRNNISCKIITYIYIVGKCTGITIYLQKNTGMEKDNKTKKDNDKDKQAAILLWCIGIIAGIAVVMVILYWCNFSYPFSKDQADWGNFGSYMGSITGLLAFIGVLYSIHNANKNATEAKEEAEKVRNEAAAADKEIRDAAKIESIKLQNEAQARDERDLFFRLIDSHQRTMETIIAKGDSLQNRFAGLLALEFYARETDNNLHTFLLLLPIGDYKNFDEWVEKTNVIKHGDNIYSDLRKSFMNAANKTYLYDDLVTEQDFYSFIRGCAIRAFTEHHLMPIHKYIIKEELIPFRQYPQLIYEKKDKLERYTIFRIVALCFYTSYSSYLSYHFNNVCYITQMLDSLENNKEFYMDYWKSKLSSNECLVLFFYLLSGKVDLEIVRLFLKYNLLDNIASSDIFELEQGEKLKMMAIDSLNKLIGHTKETVLLSIK